MDPYAIEVVVSFFGDEMHIETRGQLYNLCPTYLTRENAHYLFLKEMSDISIAKKLPLHIWFHSCDFGTTEQSMSARLQCLVLGLLKSYWWK